MAQHLRDAKWGEIKQVALVADVLDTTDSGNFRLSIGGERIHLSIDDIDAVGSTDPGIIGRIQREAAGRKTTRVEEEATRPRAGVAPQAP